MATKETKPADAPVDEPKPDAPTLETPTPETAKPEESREDARKRAEECGREVEAVCAKHGCRIVPYLAAPEPVGQDGSAAIMRASYAFSPF